MTELTGRRIAAPPRVDGEVASPDDEDSTSGRFQLRCRELIGEIRSVGFEPGGWIGLINRLGAVGAAKQLIETHRILPVTRFLVGQGRPDLTMEHEMCDSKWSELFTEAECDEARRRLASVEGNGGGTPSRR